MRPYLCSQNGRVLEPRPILIVEDDDAVRSAAEAMLTDAGYRVLTAPDGVSAFGVLERHPDVALLFTDIMMPRIDGLMLADMAKVRRPDLKILYATAYGPAANRQPGYRYGQIIDKPYRRAELIAAVQQALEAPSQPMRPHAPDSRQLEKLGH